MRDEAFEAVGKAHRRNYGLPPVTVSDAEDIDRAYIRTDREHNS